MKTEYWHQKWKSGDIAFNQPQCNKLLQRYFSVIDLPMGARILVPLCGKSIDMLWLAHQGYKVIGVELSPIACEAFFNEHNIGVSVNHNGNITVFKSEKITLFAGDFFQFSKSTFGKIDGVYDRAALVALPAKLRQCYVQHLITLLETDSVIFLITTAYNQKDMQGPPFSVDEHEVAVLYKDYFSIHQLYNKSIKTLPTHFRDKGLTQGNEQAYSLVFNGFKANTSEEK